MSTDFTKNAVSLLGGILPGSINTPGDIRCRVATEADIADIPNPYVGMVIYVLDTGKRFEVLTLKSRKVGMTTVDNALVDTYREITVDLAKLAVKEELHHHNNLDILSNISETDISYWNAKVDLSQVPTKVSDLENDLSFVREEAHIDLRAMVEDEIERAQAAELTLDGRVAFLESIDHNTFALKADVEAAMAAHDQAAQIKFEEVNTAVAELKKLIDEEKPYLTDIAAYPTSKFLFACGQPMTVEPNTGFKYSAEHAEDDVAFVYRWAEGFECIMVEKAVAEKVYVVGGYGDKNVGVKRSIPQTNILVKNVKIKGVVGGNYFEGMVGHVDMELENCEFVSIIGGGWCGASLDGVTTRMNIVDDVNIKATNCKITSTLFGGAQGNGVTDDVHIELNNCEVGWLTAGGANGMTRDAVIEMNGGSVKVAQSTNRGVVHKAKFVLNDGIVNKLYFGGETEDTTVNGLIEEGFVELNGGVVKQFAFGTNNKVELAAEKIKGTIMDCVVEAGDISMLTKIGRHPGFVDKDEFNLASQAMNQRVSALEEIDHDLFAVKKDVDARFASQEKYKISDVPKGTLVDYREKEIRVMCPKDAVFTKQNVGEGGSSNMYYMTFTTYFPEEAVAFREGDKGVLVDEYLNFEDTAGTGIDKHGRKFKQHWFALASLSGTTWNYFGKGSSLDKYIGWTYCVEYYNENGDTIGSDCIRINLSNEDCHNAVEPYYGFRIADKKYVDEQILTHDHEAISDKEIDDMID